MQAANNVLLVRVPTQEAVDSRELQDYRAAHGRGCLAEVSKATRTRGRLSDSTLRMLLTGDTVLPIEDWRRIGRALERLERQEKEEASHAG